jgi:hypothetical protein
MKVLDRIRRWWRLLRVTLAVFTTFDSIFKPFSADLRAKMRDDEFVIAYMYGVMMCFFDFYGVVGQGTRPAQILCRAYESFSPGHGKEVVELTVVRIKGKDEVFMGDLRTGAKEASQYLGTKGKSGLPGLTGHLASLCP